MTKYIETRQGVVRPDRKVPADEDHLLQVALSDRVVWHQSQSLVVEGERQVWDRLNG